jgi:iron(III) transport system substrate-binding protein
MILKAKMKSIRLTAVMLASAVCTLAGTAQGADEKDLVAAALKEGTLTVYHATDAAYSKPLFDGFSKKYGIQVVDMDLGVSTTYSRIIAEFAASQVTADIAWSSAMDTMLALAQDGYAETYQSSEASNIPAWANYQDTVYATTVEPYAVVFNTDALKEAQLPKTYAEMIAFLKDQKSISAKTAAYDPEKAGAGFINFMFDSQQRPDFWDWASALGTTQVKLYSGSGSVKEGVLSGENSLALGVIGSYAFGWAKESPKIGVHFFTDYTPAFSRLALITKGAPHPNAAKLFLDYMLSKDGQQLISGAGLPSVRSDLKDVLTFDTLNARVGGGLKPIPLDDKLVDFVDPMKRAGFLKQWRAAIGR